MRILIAEDDVTSRNILSAILKKWGFEPVATEDGDAAWAALQQADPPRLLLLDRNMPGLEGVEICRRLRAAESSDPPYIILLTAHGEKSDVVQGLEAGANDYVAKPYDNEELLARLRVGQRMLELQARLREASDTLAHQATHDPLTGLLNRRAILERFTQELSRAKRESGSLSVGMFDVDHFKNVNDTHGHQVGDEALIGFAACIQRNLRDYDCVGRYGGEEFLVLMASPSGRVEEGRYEQLREAVERTAIATKSGNLSVTVSIGVARGTGESTVDTLLTAADAALYQAKAAGRNRAVYAGS